MPRKVSFSLVNGSRIAILITGAVALSLWVLALAALPTGFYLKLLPGPLCKFAIILTGASFLFLLTSKRYKSYALVGAFPLVALIVSINPQPETGIVTAIVRFLLGVCVTLNAMRWTNLVILNLERRIRLKNP